MKRIAVLAVACALLLAHHAKTDDIPYVELKGHTDKESSIVFVPGGKRMIILGTPDTLWDVETGKEVGKLPAKFMSYSPDGKKILTSTGTAVRIWNLSTLEKQAPSPLDLPPVEDEDDNAYRERILAEERAKELALIEAERKIIPLVEEPDKLIPLDPVERIWITPDRKSVVLIGRVVLREGFLELLACRVASK